MEQDRKNGRGLARGARYLNHPNQARGRFGENDQRGKGNRHHNNDRFRRSDGNDRKNRFGGKGWGRRNGKGDYERRPTEWRSGNNNTPTEWRSGSNNTPTEWRSGNNNTHRDGRRPNHAHGGNKGRFFMEDRCTWDQCRGKPSHSRRDCPEEAKKACTRLQCRGLLHFRNQCPNARGGQLTSGDRTRSNPQVNVLSRNQQLAQQLEQHYQQAGSGQEVQMEFAPHNRQ
jgi:hypothetical protein